MYTKCPECNSIFEVTATDLAVAGGFVRCGQCTASFDALNSLSDNMDSVDATAAADSGPRAESIDVAVDEVYSGNETVSAEIESAETDSAETDSAETDSAETDSAEAGSAEAGSAEAGSAEADSAEADSAETAATESAESLEPDATADDDEILLDDDYEPPFSDGEFFDDEDAVDDIADDDDLLVATSGLAGPEFDDFSTAALDDPGPGLDPEDHKQEQDTVNQSALFSLPLPELTALEHTEHGVLPEKLEGGEAARDPSAQAQSRAQTESAPGVTETPATAVASPWLRTNDAFDAKDARDLRDYLSDPVNPATRAAWIGGSVLMALLLIGQVVHRYRGDLVIHPRFGPIVQSLYETVGVDLRPNWQVNEYKIIGQARLFLLPLDDDNQNGTKTGDGTAENATAIRFVTIISNDAKLPQPAPLVRLTLRNRWGDATGSRDFTPPEYLADRTMIGQLLEPGQRLRVVLNLYDFGADAVGFDFDMCLPDDSGTLRCAGES